METVTIPEYVELVEATLENWLKVHTDPDTWADEWTAGETEYIFKESPVLSNNYFTFDWRAAALKRWAKAYHGQYRRCLKCHTLHDHYDTCGCVDGDEPEGPVSARALVEWLHDTGEDEYINIGEDILLEALKKDGFRTYREGIRNTIQPVVSEVKDVLKKIRKSKTNEDRLEAVLWGTRVYHVNGNIMADYGEVGNNSVGIDVDVSKLVDSVRNGGLESIWTRDEIREYLAQ